MDSLKRALAWAQKNERHLGAVLFVFGFITDLFTFAFLSITLVNLAFIGYLALSAICTLGSHLFASAHDHPTVWRRTLAVLFPLGAQYAIGSLLSGCLIFYTKSASVFVSWPFLLILAAVFIGNEYFRTYYKHLAFQVVLLFFAIYAYAIFAVPLVLHQLGPWMFILSTVLSLILFVAFLFLLARLRRPDFVRSLRYAAWGVTVIVVIMSASYFTGLVPPIPLTLPSAGVYHSIEHRGGDYVVTTEGKRAWWDIRTQIIHHVPGTPLYAFSSISAPFAFDTSIVHVWERYDTQKKGWVERNRIIFPITGGRDGGYRGYSEVADPEAGKWRVTIETKSHQVIGRVYFIVEAVDTAPLIQEEQK
ncbi:MAG: hypothetical protein JWO84_236 [Parcubacteria group bacterium]|nr:hypothetical protein [Parcubacteria group bacterium]